MDEQIIPEDGVVNSLRVWSCWKKAIYLIFSVAHLISISHFI